MTERLDPDVFDLPVDAIRRGHFSDAYLNRSKELLESSSADPRVRMQTFQRKEAVLAGIDEAIAMLRLCSGHVVGGSWVDGWDSLSVRALYEGDRIEPWEPVLEIEGPFARFAHLETLYLGALARRTLLATNVARAVEAAAGKPVLFFPARHDHHTAQAGDGWAAHVGGVEAVSTDAQGSWWDATGIGTIPHALIAACGGDTVVAAREFAGRFAGEMRIVVLVDFDNDSVETALAVADALGDRLWGVRLDTSDKLVDRSLLEEMGEFEPTGVNVELAGKVRAALDAAGHGEVRIVVSGGFDAARITEFERRDAPVDVYGVGSALLRGGNDFTADVVEVDGRPCAKVGRSAHPNERLSPVD